MFVPIGSVGFVSSLHLNFLCCCPFHVLSLAVDWWLDPGYHSLVVAVHVKLSRCFCTFAILALSSVHEHAYDLLAVYCWVV